MKIIKTEKAPAAIGPYSQAIAVNGLVYTSGQIALDPETGELAGDIGTSLSGTEAVEMGLIDELGGLSQALDFLHAAIAE